MRPCFASLLIVFLFSSLRPSYARAQQVPRLRTTYFDAAHTQRRAVFGTVLRGSRPDTVPHGPYRRYWRTGGLAETGHFTQGLADSVWTRYYPAAPGRPPAVARRLAMRAGQPDGPFVVLHPNGRLAQRGTFRRGQLLDSVTTRTASGQPRLLAQFAPAATDSARPTASFRQWHGAYTAAPPNFEWSSRRIYGGTNPYPATDSGRYWTGQLTDGRPTGVLTEKDADGQLRIRLVFDAAGRLQLITHYYPAAWLRNEAKQYRYEPADSLPRSLPAWQYQAVGPRPYLLIQLWDLDGGKVKVLRYADGSYRHPGPPRCGLAAAPAPVEVGALTRLLGHGGAWSQPYRRTSEWPVVPGLPAPPPPAQPPPRVHEPRLLPLNPPSPWLLGTTDTLTGAYTPVPELVSTEASGARTFETLRATREYRADGTLRSEELILRSGALVNRSYYPNGHLQVEQRTYPGPDDKRSLRRSWSESGQLQAVGRVHRNGHLYGRTRDKNGHLPLFSKPLNPRQSHQKPRRPAPKKRRSKQIKPLHRTH